MRIDQNYKLRKIAGENLVVKVKNIDSDMTNVISLNGSSAWLWEQLIDREFSAEDAVELLVGRYEVTQERASEDVARWIDALKNINVIL